MSIPRPPRCAGPRQRGAALLMAMIIVAMVATLASAMIWQQWRAVQVETAARARAQSAWILYGALDWSRLILGEELRNGSTGQKYTSLDQPWATPLEEARLSTFLAADAKSETNDGPEAFLSGVISDATAKFNVMNVVDTTAVPPVENKPMGDVLRALCRQLNVANVNADLIIKGLVAAQSVNSPNPPPNPPLLPARVEQLVWYGVDPAALKRLEPHLLIIPDGNGSFAITQLNVNTASAEAMVAVTGLDTATVQSLIQKRPLKDLAAVTAAAPGINTLAIPRISFLSAFFEVRGRMRLEDRVLEQKALVQRLSRTKLNVLVRDDVSLQDAVK